MNLAPFAVIFDADGIIFDSEQISLRAFMETVAEFGPELDEDDVIANCGQTDAAIIAYLAKNFGAHIEYEEFKRRKFARYCDYAEREPVEVFEGAVELIDELKSREIPFGIASSGAPEKIEFNLTKAGIADRFSVIVSGEALGVSKPDPGVFLHTAHLLEMPPNRCLVFEDSVNGVSGAKAGGMSCIAVTNTFGRPLLREADLIVDSLADLSFVQIHDLALRQHATAALDR